MDKLSCQASIEKIVGITDKDFADYISMRSTPASKNVYNLLKMQVNFYDETGMKLLRCAVEDCKKEYYKEYYCSLKTSSCSYYLPGKICGLGDRNTPWSPFKKCDLREEK